ncbi:MAG: ABC transporter permease [Nitrososphaerota archaeon]|nr:ABC transporter permease [Nitrososphaerales archaeon]MDW8044623.1 ABC transporter permease [Nitrososphaerota archaeon]
MSLGRFLISRTLNMVLVLFVTIFITIAIVGPAMDTILKRSVEIEVKASILQSKEVIARFRDPKELENYIQLQVKNAIESLGLNEPWYSPRRLWTVIWRLISLDLGQSYYLRSFSGSESVKEIILEALPKTILLFTTATVLNSIIGILLGVAVARRSGLLIDKFTSTFAVVSTSFPLWWVGMIMIILFAYNFRIFPARATPLIPPTDPNYPLALLYHMILPLLTLVVIGFGSWTYVVRNLMIGILQEDYITVAMAKGTPERKILYGHALRSAAPPMITMIALSLSGSLGGAIITEAVFDWPGIGRLYWNAVSALDLPVIIGLTYITTVVFLISIFIADILYSVFDPRVKVG